VLLDILKGVWTIDREAYENGMRVRIRQWAEALVVLLPCGIPQGEFDMFSIYIDVFDDSFKDCRDVDLLRRHIYQRGDESKSMTANLGEFSCRE
jgi:hypothetical protein